MSPVFDEQHQLDEVKARHVHTVVLRSMVASSAER